MHKHLFWLNWENPLKQLASILFAVFIALIIAALVLVIIGPEGILGWHTYSQKETIEVISKTVNVGPFSFPFAEQLIIIKEFVAGGEMPNTAFIKEITLVSLFIMVALVLALISYFNRFGFILFAGFVFFFIIFLHPEMLKLAQVNDYWILGAMFFVFIGPAYYFQAFNKDAPFGARVITLLIVVGAFLAFVVWQSEVNSPLNLLFSYGILAPYLVVLLFIFMVGHEIISGFILAIASGTQDTGNNRIKHFLVLSVIYLLNVLIAYLQITHVIDWDFVSVNPILILGTASILGVWGISQRFVLYKKVNASQQVWVLLYLALAIISFFTITYLLYSLEDPMLKIITDFIIFSQLAFGTAFLLYVLYNFISIIEEGHSVKDILYKPQNLPHMSYRVLGVAILTGLVLMRDINYPIWYSLGGYYNSIAGYFEDEGDNELAALFYAKGADLSKKNHKSNYKLGTFYIDDDRAKAIEYFDVASSRVPTAQSFINKANLESTQGNYFDALFTLQKGASVLPTSVEIQNNLGLQFSKAQILDSAWIYFSKAKDFKPAQNNGLGFILKNSFSVSSQDSSFLFSDLDKVGKVNASALGYHVALNGNFNGNDMMDAALLNNALINNLILYDPSSYKQIKAVIDSANNEVISEELNYAMAIYELHNEQIFSGLERLQKLAGLGSERQSKYFELVGLVNLEYGAYTKAEEAFLLANEFKMAGEQKSHLIPLALAQSEAGYFTDAILAWKQVKREGNAEDSVQAVVMIQVLSSILNQNDSIGRTDLNFYLKARYQRLWVDEFAVKSTFEQIQDTALKNELALELAIYYFNTGNHTATKLFYDLIDLNVSSDNILEHLLKFNIRLAYDEIIPDKEGQIKNLYEAGFEFAPNEQLEKMFYKSNLTKITKEDAEMLSQQNPFFAEGVVWAAHYFKTDDDMYKSYNILQEALNKNPDNRLLLEAYILEAISIGFEEYANNALQHYRELFPGDLFYTFLQKVEQTKAQFDAMANEEV